MNETGSGLTYTVKEFCRETRISHKSFYQLLNNGIGPKLIRIGRRVYIRRETAREWLQEREAATLS